MSRPSPNSMEAKLDPDKKWVWIEDSLEGYIAGYVVAEKGDQIQVVLTNDQTRWVSVNDTDKVNPPKFDRVEDMADLSYLNEASVAHNLKMRYLSNLIYTYSGLFLVVINPYYKLPIYTDKMIRSYKNKRRTEMPPHIYSVADSAFHYMLQNRENQSILITGESGAGKTENTKKVIQYLTSVATDRMHGKQTDMLEQQILRANPILEAFGNAQTIRNNNSSRFGKFIRIEFSSGGQIAGANIEKYLFEKSRVTHQSTKERNYHIFYQFMKGASKEVLDKFLITSDMNSYAYLKNSTKDIDGVDDATDFKITKESMGVMQFNEEQQQFLFRVLASVLHLGNIRPTSDRDDQAQLRDTSIVEKLCHVLGIPVAEFTKGLLRPQMKAGRDWVTQARTVGQVVYSLESLARAIYERMFGTLVEWINLAMHRRSEKSTFIGVLDIAGFEIFEFNSFEQLCINYNNEKLQQFFNHHMFKREQEEYLREGIDWKMIDFGMDLQPTIDLIEKSNPIGILSCLDEECVMPKATDKTFTEKLITLWKDKNDKFEILKFNQGFILKHYASNVEYRTEGWLDKNKDPLNENITRLLAHSSEKYIATLFEDYLSDVVLITNRTRTKKGVFRTVGQRHKEQLSLLMSQLHSTEPHFVRCILPNQEKKPGRINTLLVLDQLRCNGVLEGIRICRAGFPNRLPFSEFRQRYEILAPGSIPRGFMDGKNATQRILEAVQLDPNRYRIGGSKVFFRAGVLAELEETRDANLTHIVSQIQAASRGFLARKFYRKRIDQVKAIRIIQKNARVYVQLREWSWWKLYTKVKPLLNVTRVDEELKKKEDSIKTLENEINSQKQNREEFDRQRSELENEKRKIEELLMSERSAALDNEEILRRTQKREVDLEEGLREMAVEFEQLEAQLEEASQIRTEALSKYEEISHQLEEQLLHSQKIDKEKALREQQLTQLQAELKSESDRSEKISQERKALEVKISELQEALSFGKDQESELLKVKTKHENQINELLSKLQADNQERIKLEERRVLAESELKNTLEKTDSLDKKVLELQSQLDKHVVEFSNIGKQLKSEESAKVNMDKQCRNLTLKIETLENELDVEKSEKDKVLKHKKKLEDEIVGLHKLIEEKGDVESKQNEHRRLRETEVAELRAALEQCQSELQDVRRSNSNINDSLKSELEKFKIENEVLLKARESLDSQAKEISLQLETAEEKISNLEKAKRNLEKSMDNVVDRASDLEASLVEMKGSKEELEQLLNEAHLRNEESESNLSRLQREKQSAERQMSLFQEELSQEIEKRESSEATKKKLALELSDLQARIGENESVKEDLRKKLATKSAELQAVKDQFSSESTERVASVEEARRKVEVRLAELQPAHDELTRQCASLNKSKLRLMSEIEDLKHEIEREHSSTRNAEKMTKQIEAQLSSVTTQLETERQEREAAEANYRKIQSSYNSLEKQIDEKSKQFNSISKSKSDMESELRALINEIGDGGRNLHELEKAKRRLESELDAKLFTIEELDAKLVKAEETRRLAEEQLADFQKTNESQLLIKDAQLEETRRLLLKEVNQLGERLDEETAQKNDLLKVRKRLEDEIDDLMSNVDYSTQSKSELEHAKRKAEEYIKTLQSTLESEERLRINFEELAQRHELKSNQLQSKLESLELQLEALDKIKRQLEQRVQDLTQELEEGESKASLLESIRRLEKEKKQVEEDLFDERDARSTLQKTRSISGLDSIKSQVQLEMKEQFEALEDSRRALLVAQRMLQQDVESKQREIESVEKSRNALQAEIDSLKQKLEEEIQFKNSESASQRRYKRAFNELVIKLEAEQARCAEFKDSCDSYKEKIEDLMNNLEASELAKNKALKQQGNLESRALELEDSLLETETCLHEAEQKIRELEELLLEKENHEEESFSNVSGSNLRLAEELQKIREETERDFQERAKELEDIRSKYHLRLADLTQELEEAQNEVHSLQATNENLNSQVSTLTGRLDSASQESELTLLEKEKLEIKLAELSSQQVESSASLDNLLRESEQIKIQLRQVKGQLEVKESECISLSKSKRFLQEQLDDIEGRFNSSDQTRLSTERSLSEMGQEAFELKEELDQQKTKADMLSSRLIKMEHVMSESQNDLSRSRQANADLLKSKSTLEKQIKELEFSIIDLKSSSHLSGSFGGASRLTSRIDELASQLESETTEKNELLLNIRKAERMIRDLQFQLQERDKQRSSYESTNSKSSQVIQQLRNQVFDLENAESALQLAKRRSEREVTEEREKNARLEREVERLKARIEKNISTAPSPYGSIKSPSMSVNTMKSPILTASTLSVRRSKIGSTRGPSIANSNFRELLYAFQNEEEPSSN